MGKDAKNIPDPADAAVLLLVGGYGTDDAQRALESKLGLSPAKASAAIADAQRRVTLAADYHRVHEIGAAKKRLEDIYRSAREVGELAVALQTQKEISKLLDLYARPADHLATSAEADNADGIIDAIRDHIAGIAEAAGAPEDYPLEERVRVVAELARETIARRRQ